MEITSYFIGTKITSRTFVNLFVSLQQYLKDNNLTSAIEIQDIHSLHITLYYFSKEILTYELDSLKKSISVLNSDNKNFRITAENFAYFKQDGIDYLCYITCSQTKKLEKINNQFSNQYKKDDIVDNQYKYIPHISLFKVLNHNDFIIHKDKINSIIEKELKEIKDENVFDGFFLFAVNSKFHPEIQLPFISL